MTKRRRPLPPLYQEGQTAEPAGWGGAKRLRRRGLFRLPHPSRRYAPIHPPHKGEGGRFGIAALAFLGSALAGCGFTPLYATPGVSAGLSAIDVVVPEGRVAFLLREDLDDALGHDKAAAPVWRLDIAVSQTRDPRGLRIDNVAERYQLGLKVKYTLTEIATGKIAHGGEIATQVSYDAADAPYAGIAARQDSQDRVASDAARRIQLDLAAWIAHPRPG